MNEDRQDVGSQGSKTTGVMIKYAVVCNKKGSLLCQGSSRRRGVVKVCLKASGSRGHRKERVHLGKGTDMGGCENRDSTVSGPVSGQGMLGFCPEGRLKC